MKENMIRTLKLIYYARFILPSAYGLKHGKFLMDKLEDKIKKDTEL
jgi:hypothetical protein